MKKIMVTAAVILCLTTLTGCGGREIDDMAYVVAIGVDSNEKGGYSFTLAIGNPGSISGEGGDENVLILESAEGDNIFTAGEAIGTKTGQMVNFSHAELMVFSESVSLNGVDKFLDGITRNLNQRPKLVPITAKDSAGKVIGAIHSQFEGNPEKYLKKIFESSIVSTNIDGRRFLSRTKILDGGVAIPRSAEYGGTITVDAMSVFDGDRAVGVFNDIFAYKLLCGEVKGISYDLSGGGTLILTRRKEPSIKISCEDIPKIDIFLTLSSTVAAVSADTDKAQLRLDAGQELEKRIYDLLKYSSADVHLDFLGLYKYARGNFLTWQDWDLYNWREKYPSASFNVNVEILPEKTGLIRGEI